MSRQEVVNLWAKHQKLEEENQRVILENQNILNELQRKSELENNLLVQRNTQNTILAARKNNLTKLENALKVKEETNQNLQQQLNSINAMLSNYNEYIPENLELGGNTSELENILDNE